ncbi:MAG TPA: ASKHA domain-containing protein [Planctomycetota bacterium]
MLTKNDALSLPVKPGDGPVLLSEVAVAAGVHLDLRCGGNGICKRCQVKWEGQEVLACQTSAIHEGVMLIPPSSQVPEEWAVESAFAPPVPRASHPRCRRVIVRPRLPRELPGTDDWERVCRAAFPDGKRPLATPEMLCKLPAAIEAGAVRLTLFDDEVIDVEAATDKEKPVLGLAIDVGTTTVVVRLMDMATGEQLALAGAQNRQVSMGANVISRIAVGSTGRGLELLQKLVNEKTIVPLIEKCVAQAGAKGQTIHHAVIGGNTCMAHLLLGLPPKGLGVVPFNAVALAPAAGSGAPLGLPVNKVECLPAAGAYIGGDVLGGVYAQGLDHSGPPEMLIDVGTNSEIVLRVGDKLYGASAPAGPAFEGGGLSCGGPAGPGAVTHLRLENGAFQIETYKNTVPAHICGSAYVDFLALGREHGFISVQGRYQGNIPVPPGVDVSAEEKNALTPGKRCVLAKGVYIDEQDLALLLQAKAAVLSGVLILLRTAGILPGDLHTLHVAGGFGRHLNPAHAVRIALLPSVPLDRIKIVGNTSLSACCCALLNGQASGEMRHFARRVRVVELNLEPDFEDSYIDALMMP